MTRSLSSRSISHHPVDLCKCVIEQRPQLDHGYSLHALGHAQYHMLMMPRCVWLPVTCVIYIPYLCNKIIYIYIYVYLCFCVSVGHCQLQALEKVCSAPTASNLWVRDQLPESRLLASSLPKFTCLFLGRQTMCSPHPCCPCGDDAHLPYPSDVNFGNRPQLLIQKTCGKLRALFSDCSHCVQTEYMYGSCTAQALWPARTSGSWFTLPGTCNF